MKIDELERRLLEENFPAGSYNLEGEKMDGGFSLRHVGNHWIVDYCERGDRFFVAEFAYEDHVCDFFLGQMRKLVPNRKGVGGRLS